MSHDVFQCPHDGCVFTLIESCHPHTEVIGDQSENAGRHCWDEHRCVESHPHDWKHTDDFELDYKELLKKYIDHVGDSEGTTFLMYRPREHCRITFTDQEWAELQSLDV